MWQSQMESACLQQANRLYDSECYPLEILNIFSVVKCSCSICVMKQNHHFIVPKEDFTLLSGESELTVYTFNTHAAR